MSVEHLEISGCGCPENRRGFSRRAALAGAAALGAAAGVTAGVTKVFGADIATQYAYAGAGYDGDTVVVLSLRGGFDGLSALIPLGDPAYVKARPNLGVPLSRAIKLDSMFGLHPALAPLKKLWDNGVLGAVQAVGMPNPTRSHFLAMEQMENAAPGSNLRTGWLDRMIGLTPADQFGLMAVGSAATPGSMAGPNPKSAVRTIAGYGLYGASTDADLASWTTAMTAMHEGAPQLRRDAAANAMASVAAIGKLAATGYTATGGAAYPTTDLGAALKDCANLIKSGIGLRAATIDCGNWDMHVDLGRSDAGWMFDNLTDLGNSLAAFAADLGDKLANVTLVTLSEFGRRVAENGSGGLDHGYGNASLLLGGGVVGGKVHGTWPGLSAEKLVDGDLAVTTDYRMMLAEILEKRAKLSSSDVFPGLSSTRLGALKPR